MVEYGECVQVVGNNREMWADQRRVDSFAFIGLTAVSRDHLTRPETNVDR